MHLDSLLDLYTKALNIYHVDYEDGSKKIESLKKHFNDHYKIVPKEQWCVGITTLGGFAHNVGIQGTFNNELEASIFADIWNRKRDEYIEKVNVEHPDEELDIPFLLAKHYKLEISEGNKDVLDEMVLVFGAAINKLQNGDINEKSKKD